MLQPTAWAQTDLCFCCQAGHRGSSALALQPRLGLGLRATRGHVLHLYIDSLCDSSHKQHSQGQGWSEMMSHSHFPEQSHAQHHVDLNMLKVSLIPGQSHRPLPHVLSAPLLRLCPPVLAIVPQGSRLSGHAPGWLLPRREHLGSSVCPRKRTP